MAPVPTKKRNAFIGLGALLCAGACEAGRPLTVDDANVNDAGSGHVELWSAREPGRVHTWTVAPAYGLTDNIELGAAVSRNRTEKTYISSLQAKIRWTESQPEGCNFASTFAHSHVHAGGGEAPSATGIMTCNQGVHAFHANLGLQRLPHSSRSLATWGFAVERDFGNWTGHAEAFGQRRSKPAFQLGARTDLLKNLQIDTTIGRHDRSTLFSVGAKVSF